MTAMSHPLPADAGHDPLPEAWARWQAASRQLEANGDNATNEQDAPFRALISAADDEIFATPATTIAGAVVKLKSAMIMVQEDRWLELLLIEGDDAGLLDGRENMRPDCRLIYDAATTLEALSVPAATDPHLGWFNERQRLLTASDASHATHPDGRDPTIRTAIAEISDRIMATPASTRDGILAKALLITDQHLGPDDNDASRLLAEAAALNIIEVTT